MERINQHKDVNESNQILNEFFFLSNIKCCSNLIRLIDKPKLNEDFSTKKVDEMFRKKGEGGRVEPIDTRRGLSTCKLLTFRVLVQSKSVKCSENESK